MDVSTFPATLDSLEAIGTYVKNAAAKAGLDARASYKLHLAVDEIATNIIVHGHQEAGIAGDLALHATLGPDSLRVVLEDRGVPFDPRQTQVPNAEDLSKPLEERQLGGLGVFLALTGVDSFDYQRVEGRNRNIFVMRRKGNAAAGPAVPGPARP